jgi:hypothetical protein
MKIWYLVIAEPYVCKLLAEGAFQLMTMLFTTTMVDGALGASGTTAAIAVTMLEVVLKPIELRA